MKTYRCDSCGEISDESEIGHTPELSDEPSWLRCGCGSTDLEEIRPCDECGEFVELVEGTDTCGPCLAAIAEAEALDRGDWALEQRRGS